MVTIPFIANHFHVSPVPHPGVGKSLGLSAVVRIAFITNRFNVPGVGEKIWFECRCLICGDNCAQLGPGPSVGHNVERTCCLFKQRLPTNLPVDWKILRVLEHSFE